MIAYRFFIYVYLVLLHIHCTFVLAGSLSSFFLSKRIIPIMMEVMTNNSVIMPAYDLVAMLYVIHRGETGNVILRTYVGLSTQNPTEPNTIPNVGNKENIPSHVKIPMTTETAIKKNNHPICFAH